MAEPRERGATLPAPATSFVGRKAELVEVGALIDGGARLVTLRGAPGVGKTRLAIEACRALLGRSRLGVAFVDLTGARELGGVVVAVGAAIARDLGAGDTDAQITRVGTGLRDAGRFVLVLDNVEQVLDATRTVLERWLDLAPQLVVVLTSRERVALPDERVFEVLPLAVPSSDADDATLARNDAITLFLARARLVRSGLVLEGEELRTVAELVRRVDGLPLAIELASARMGVASARELIELLTRSLDVLVARGAGRTLRAAIDESWMLLSEPERGVLMRLSLFRAGFALGAAAGIVAVGTDRASRRLAALDTLQALVDKSLVHAFAPAAGPSERRFRLLEAVAEYAGEQLDASGARPDAERAHALAVIESAEELARAPHPSPATLASLVLEEENLLATFERALAAGRAEHALRALVCLGRIYVTRGPGVRYLALADRSATALAEVAPALAAQAHAWRGRVAMSVGRYEDAAQSFEHAEALFRSEGDLSSLAFVVTKQALMDHFTDQPARARARCTEALALAARAAPTERLSVLEGVGLVRLRESETADARPVLEEALALARALSDRTVEGRVLGYLGWCAFDAGQLVEARTHLELAIDVLASAGDHRSRAAYLGDTGLVLAELGLVDAARARLLESLAEHERLGDRWHRAERVGTIGFLELEVGNVEEARKRLREACALHAETRDRASAALFYAGLGACAAEISDAVDAERMFQEAVRMCESDARPPMREAIAALRRHLELDQARRAAVAGDRASASATALAIAAQARAALDARPHTEVRPALRLLARNALALARKLEEGAHASSPLRVAVDGSAVTLGGDAIAVPRAAERRILRALAESRQRAPGECMSVDALFAAGWGDESAGVDARTNRVRVALSSLRKLALKPVLETLPDGYRLDPAAAIEIA